MLAYRRIKIRSARVVGRLDVNVHIAKRYLIGQEGDFYFSPVPWAATKCDPLQGLLSDEM